MPLNCFSKPQVYQLSSEIIDEICAGPGYGEWPLRNRPRRTEELCRFA